MSDDPRVKDRINSFALVSYIPEPLAGFLNRLRQELVPNCFLRAHVTVLPPREISGTIEDASSTLAELVPAFGPFDLKLTGVEVFPISDVIHIALGSGREQLLEMHAAMNTGALRYKEPFPYHPHITLAQNLKPDELDELIQVARQRWAEATHGRSVRVETLTFVQGTKYQQWVDLSKYRLATGLCLK